MYTEAFSSYGLFRVPLVSTCQPTPMVPQTALSLRRGAIGFQRAMFCRTGRFSTPCQVLPEISGPEPSEKMLMFGLQHPYLYRLSRRRPLKKKDHTLARARTRTQRSFLLGF